MDFLNKNQKVYIGEEEKKVFLEKLKRDVEVRIGVLPSALLSKRRRNAYCFCLPFIVQGFSCLYFWVL